MANRAWKEEANMQILNRTFGLLRLLSGHPNGLSQTEIAQTLELPAPTVYRILKVMTDEGFVSRSATNKRYFLGPEALDLSRHHQGNATSLTLNSHLESLSHELSETVFLSELRGSRVYCTQIMEADRPLRLFVQRGQVLPAHAAAAARAILAWLPESDLKHVIANVNFEKFTDETILNAEDLLKHLEGVREQGYDLCESELDEEVWAMAAPIFSATGNVVASLTVAGPMQRFNNEVLTKKARQAVAHTAAAMSSDLGWNPMEGTS